MIIKIVKTLLILIVSILFTIQPSTSSPTENVKFASTPLKVLIALKINFFSNF